MDFELSPSPSSRELTKVVKGVKSQIIHITKPNPVLQFITLDRKVIFNVSKYNLGSGDTEFRFISYKCQSHRQALNRF